MDNSELLNEINIWQNEFQNPNFNNKLIELAFFKIFVKFEKFLSHLFTQYSTGKKSGMSYKPKRKLGFSSSNQLYDVIRGSNRSYIDIPKLIKSLSPHIFKDNDDPFFLVFSDPTFSDNYTKMQVIRNFIAHESIESRTKYINNVLNTYNITSFIEASDFLLRNTRVGNSYYTMFTSILQQYSNILINPASYLGQTTHNQQLSRTP